MKRKLGYIPNIADDTPISSGISLVAGLGNPGRKYRRTRHNAGIIALGHLVSQCTQLRKARWRGGNIALLKFDSHCFLALEPREYMNRSGLVVAPVSQAYGIPPERLLLLHDDIDIPLGEIKVKRGGGSAGHKGVESVAEALGSSSFVRVRIGVGRPPENLDPVDYVLGELAAEELEALGPAIEKACAVTLEMVGKEDL